VRQSIRRQEAVAPGTLHHFEYLAPVTAILGMSRVRTIWSMNDIESRYFAEMYDLRSSIGGPALRPSDRAYLRDVSRAEKAVARQSDLVLCIASHERDLVRLEWGCAQAEYLPMSLQDEEMPPRTRGWVEAGIVRLLHVGSPAGLASFTSLRFIIEEVLPRIDARLRERLELHVVGAFADHPRANRIRELARPYPQIRLHGFRPDVRRLYGEMDVQLVGSTQATGIRTRIIESFAYGVPVLSTRMGATGLDGAREGENIVLSDDPADFARNIEAFVAEPSRLSALANEGRNTYTCRYSRRVVAETLRELLHRHVASTSRRHPPSASRT
jgi:hypothetical protein